MNEIVEKEYRRKVRKRQHQVDPIKTLVGDSRNRSRGNLGTDVSRKCYLWNFESDHIREKRANSRLRRTKGAHPCRAAPTAHFQLEQRSRGDDINEILESLRLEEQCTQARKTNVLARFFQKFLRATKRKALFSRDFGICL